ncbi:MAG TPA: hypothetical protein VGC95_12590, partial [Chitinophagaceae bacterium]
MKKIVYLLFFALVLMISGCFETTEDVTIAKDGSGVLTHTIDLSNLVGLLKQMGGDEMKKMSNADTTIQLAGLTDSVAGFT